MIDRPRLDAFIRRSVDYLVRTCGADGLFVYRVNLDPTVRVPRRMNVLRHAGAMYALGMADRDDPRADSRAAIARAARFLHAQIARPPDWPDTFAVWSRPEVERRPGAVVEAKLGGTGLGLVALLEAERVEPGLTPPFVLRGLGAFLRAMQRPDGGFHSIYTPAAGGPREDWVSLYYPGEAALGLLRLHAFDGDPDWLRLAEAALLHLAAIRKGKDDVEADHWTLLATAEWLRGPGRSADPDRRAAILAHALQIVRSMLRRVPTLPDDSPLLGSVTGDGRTCPTATQMEGLQAARACAEDWPPSLRTRFETSVQRGVDFLLRCQVLDGLHAGGMTRGFGPDFPRGFCFTRPEDPRAAEIRVDYVQHALSAVVQYRRDLDRPAA